MKITEATLIKRINRKLRAELKQLKAYRGWPTGRASSDLGRYYAVDLDRNAIVRSHVDLVEYGRELGVFGPNEEIENVGEVLS
jgi:hypothetical protein